MVDDPQDIGGGPGPEDIETPGSQGPDDLETPGAPEGHDQRAGMGGEAEDFVPVDADGYNIRRPEVPEGVEYPEELEAAFLRHAHALGKTNKEAQEIIDRFAQGAQGGQGGGEWDYDKGEFFLKQQWGPSFDFNILSMRDAFNIITAEDPTLRREMSKYGNDPYIAMFIHRAGELIKGNVPLPQGGQGSGAPKGGKPLDKAKIQQQIDEIEANPALFQGGTMEQKRLQEKRNQLYQKLYGGKG